VVLITGAAKRLGRHIALHLAQEGWDVAVHFGRSQAEAANTVQELRKRAPQGRFEMWSADLSDALEVRQLFAHVVGAWGRIDAVINNASLFELDTIEDIDTASFDAHLRTNTLAPVVLAQCLANHLATRQAKGAVVNLLDQKLYNLNPDFLSYTLSKAALECANTLLAQALAPDVRVVGVAPGLTLTSHMLDDDAFAALHQLAPLGQSSTAQDIAQTVSFALNNPAITGTTLVVDGGQHLVRQARDFSLMKP
jgi:NAD(P)-dependent dehydrogenase (short-subunit alcohol dehydrogenase family)